MHNMQWTGVRDPSERSSLVFNGVRVTSVETIGKERDEAIRKCGHFGMYVDDVIVEMIKGDQAYSLSTEELVREVKAIIELSTTVKSPEDLPGTDVRSTVARAVWQDQSQPEALATRLGTESGKHVPGRQARAVNDYLNAHPTFEANLSGGKGPGGITFNSPKAGKMGGLYTHEDRMVYLARLDDSSPDAFVRLLLHELGHATFQQLLLERKKLHDLWCKGTAYNLMLKRQTIGTALEQTVQPHDNQLQDEWQQGVYDDPVTNRVGKLLADLKEIDDQLPVGNVLEQWQGLTQEAQEFYKAWLALRREEGKYLLGRDLGPGRGPQRRREYQTENFTEFCAETFMLAATGALASHVATLNTDPEVPDYAKNAWKTAEPILLKYRTALFENQE